MPLVVVARGDNRAEAEALEAGADAFCRWPEERAVLASRLHALLRRASGTFRISARCSLELLADTRQIRVDQLFAQLSPPEYALLRILDAARNRWIPNAELWAAVTPSAARPHDSSLLRMHVLRVRRKLGPWHFVLRTERGNGAMLTDRLDAASLRRPA